MKTVLILGSTGMLGSMTTRVLSENESISLHATVRTVTQLQKVKQTFPQVTCHLFDAEKDSIASLLEKFDSVDWIINGIGIIKPFIHDTTSSEIERAMQINGLFPHYLARSAKHSRILQIATDCVFSGTRGNYYENDIHEPHDVYGKTKSLGEVFGENIFHLRCSIIGPEIGQGRSLLEWLRTQPKYAVINGYSNHLWNGITTLHFAKICQGIIMQGIQLSHMQHIVPANRVTKFDLVRFILEAYDRDDVTMQPTIAPVAIDRTLATKHDTINRQLWNAAGYGDVLRVEEMIKELATSS